jgi:hypothetical protein
MSNLEHIACEQCGDSGTYYVQVNYADGRVKQEEASCTECCEHEFDSSEGYTCLNCGTDGTDTLACIAEDTYGRDR